jgi:hypothetical protein
LVVEDRVILQMDNLHHKLVHRAEQVLLVSYQLQVVEEEVLDFLPVLLVDLPVVGDMDLIHMLQNQE